MSRGALGSLPRFPWAAVALAVIGAIVNELLWFGLQHVEVETKPACFLVSNGEFSALSFTFRSR